MATVETILAYLAQKPSGAGFRRDRNFAAAKRQARAIDSALRLAASQAQAVDAQRERLSRDIMAYRASLQEALTLSVEKMDRAALNDAIAAANAFLFEVNKPAAFASLPPKSFSELRPKGHKA